VIATPLLLASLSLSFAVRVAPVSVPVPVPVPVPVVAVAVAAVGAPTFIVGVAAPADDADELVQYIDGLADRGLHDMVVREAESFLADHATHTEADRVRYRLATALFESGRTAEAAPQFRTLLGRQQFAYRAEAALRLGQCEMAAERWEPASEALQQVLALKAAYLRLPATFLLAECAFRRADYAGARPLYEEVLEAGRGTSDEDAPAQRHEAAAGLAWCALRLHDLDGAIGAAEALLAEHPADELLLEMHFVRGEALLEAQRPQEAREAYRAVTDGPFHDAALRGEGFASDALGDHAAAAAAFERLLSQHPESRFAGEARLQLGIQRLQAGDAAGAERARGDRELPDDAETLYWRARAQAAAGHHEQALASLDRALTRSPDDTLTGHVHTARGDVLTALGQGAAAAAAYERSGSTAARHAAAVSQLNAGNAEQALQLVEPLTVAPGASAAVHLTHAEALFALERWEQAEAAFERARAGGVAVAGVPATGVAATGSSQAGDTGQAGDPGRDREPDTDELARIESRLAWCRYLRGDLATAAQRFEALAARWPTRSEGREALFMAGRCRRGLDQRAEAEAAWRAYLALEPAGERSDEALLALAELVPPAEARRLLEALLASEPPAELAAPALLSLAELLTAQGDAASAEVRYALLVEKYPESAQAPAARYGLAYAQAGRGAHAVAATTLQPLVGPTADTARGPVAHAATSGTPAADPGLQLAALELLVFCQHELKDPAAAEAAYRRLERLEPPPERRAAAARSVADAWRVAGQPDRALELLDELAALPGQGAAALVEGAWIALDEQALDVAAERLDLALAAAPDEAAVAEASFFLAEALLAAGSSDRALPYYRAAAEAQDSTLGDKALYKQGFLALQSGDTPQAERCFGALVERFPQSELLGEALFLQGEAAYRGGRFEQALPPLQRLLAEQPRHAVLPKARFRLGLSLAELQRWKDAEAELSRLVQQTPDFENLAEAELCRGRCLVAQHQDRPARAALERVLALDKGLLAARARIALGRLALAAGDTDAALSDFLKVVLLCAHDAEVAEAMFLAGTCLEQIGEADRAAEQYRELIDTQPDSPFAAQARARLDAR